MQPLTQYRKLVNPGTGQVILPTEYPDYSQKEYWNNRYREERGQTFDWYLPWKGSASQQVGLRDILIPRLYDDKEAEILIIGCGNSEVSEKLYEEGYHYITNSDYSVVCVEEMRERNAHLDEMDYVEMDITESQEVLDSDSFTCIIDKGTLDCVACSDQYGKRTKQMLDNIHRILAPGGSYVCVSYGRPETRLTYLSDGYSWQIETQKVPKKPSAMEVLERIDQETFYYVYVCTKKY